MILNNNIKQVVEVSKSNIDRLILSLHFDSHLSLTEIARNIETAYQTTVSIDYISQTITKYTLIMAEFNNKANKIAAPYMRYTRI